MALLFNIKPLTWLHQGLCGTFPSEGGPLEVHRLLGIGVSYRRASQTEVKVMELEGEDAVRSGFAGFLGDVIWQVGQIGQAALDGLTVVLVALLIYHHGVALKAARQVEGEIFVPPTASQPVVCDLSFGLEGLCIVAQPLEPAAT
jgi:hypothetical protein